MVSCFWGLCQGGDLHENPNTPFEAGVSVTPSFGDRLYFLPLQLELETARAQVRSLTEQNRKLTDKAKCQFSYSMLKEENLSLQAQNRRLQQDLEESRNENTRILNRESLLTPSHHSGWVGGIRVLLRCAHKG